MSSDPFRGLPTPKPREARELFAEYASEFIGYELENFRTDFVRKMESNGQVAAGRLAWKLAQDETELYKVINSARKGDVVASKALVFFHRYLRKQGIKPPTDLVEHIEHGYLEKPATSSKFLDRDDRDAVVSFIFENALTYADQFSASGSLIKARGEATNDEKHAAYEIMSEVFRTDHGIEVSASTIKSACESTARKRQK